MRSEEHTSELQSHSDLVCRLLLEKKKKKKKEKKEEIKKRATEPEDTIFDAYDLSQRVLSHNLPG